MAMLTSSESTGFGEDLAEALHSTESTVSASVNADKIGDSRMKETIELEEQVGKDCEYWNTVLDKTWDILSSGRTFEYLYDTLEKLHYGDQYLLKALIISAVCGCAINTMGTHIHASGPHGCGKSDAVKKASMLIDDRHILSSALTTQAIYYLGDEINEGTIVFIDDLTWSGELGTTVKRCTTEFQKGAARALVKELEGESKKAQKRLTFWITSVDNQADEQIRDRFLMIEVESNPEHKKAVLDFMKRRDQGIESDDDLNFRIDVCKCIMADIHEHLFEVIIPFAERIMFSGEQRGYGILSDMIKC